MMLREQLPHLQWQLGASIASSVVGTAAISMATVMPQGLVTVLLTVSAISCLISQQNKEW
jgi:hypothetical protein